MPSIRSVLIANRGEISIRIAKTLSRLGVRVIGLKSSLDVGAAHLKHMDQILPLEGDSVASSWLDTQQIVNLCVKNKIDAVHPGYGFLSENEDFAQALRNQGIVFMGPSPEAIARMGSKAEAKELMIRAGVPTIPGYQGIDNSDSVLMAEAHKIGYPLLIKASAGGGGKGMRIVRAESEFAKALDSARSEAKKSFGDDRVILERYITHPRHIEFQIFGDAHGNMIHLGERECSIQRRHQKIIEETPSPVMTPELRKRMGEAAVRCGQALKYQNAGTVEFIVDERGDFYFLEVNTRLQVEHPITEMLTGQDLVEWQWRIAQGEALPLTQEQVHFRGHALECRVYAEDPENAFLPSVGPLLYYHEPAAPFLRIDSGVNVQSEIGIYFDPMIAKVIVSGATRAEAISRMIWALENYPILGVKTNSAFLLSILRHDKFAEGETHTHFIEDHLSNWQLIPQPLTSALIEKLLNSPETSPPSVQQAGAAAVPSTAASVWPSMTGFRIGVLP